MLSETFLAELRLHHGAAAAAVAAVVVAGAAVLVAVGGLGRAAARVLPLWQEALGRLSPFGHQPGSKGTTKRCGVTFWKI